MIMQAFADSILNIIKVCRPIYLVLGTAGVLFQFLKLASGDQASIQEAKKQAPWVVGGIVGAVLAIEITNAIIAAIVF